MSFGVHIWTGSMKCIYLVFESWNTSNVSLYLSKKTPTCLTTLLMMRFLFVSMVWNSRMLDKTCFGQENIFHLITLMALGMTMWLDLDVRLTNSTFCYMLCPRSWFHMSEKLNLGVRWTVWWWLSICHCDGNSRQTIVDKLTSKKKKKKREKEYLLTIVIFVLIDIFNITNNFWQIKYWTRSSSATAHQSQSITLVMSHISWNVKRHFQQYHADPWKEQLVNTKAWISRHLFLVPVYVSLCKKKVYIIYYSHSPFVTLQPP